MASSQLPTPGRLILENVTLLAGSPTAFHTRYGFTLTPTTFSKPGSPAPANAVLHFLISIIDADVAESLFKPCFPILDRDQERDFRKVVDARLAILERTKLIPVGCARKSVVASAGGDRFLDLLWSLSSLALQQACLRHPAYASVSRMRLLSHQSQSDTSSQYSASQPPQSRSSRSVLSGRSSRVERPTADSSRHRRFLGVGMLSASQQRQKDAEEMRARIDSERIALNRTTEMGQQGAKTWASEADSLRERIGDFEAKLRTLKGQLADMGFDENGVDIRAQAAQNGDVATFTETKPTLKAGATSGPLVASPSGVDLGEELKTSPIESTESCSSVDDAGDPCDDLAADLSRLLTFTVESQDRRVDVEDAAEVEKPAIPFAVVDSTELLCGIEGTVDEDAHRGPKGILHLVRVATDELEEVTNRMHEIREARERAGTEVTSEIGTDMDADGECGADAVEPVANREEPSDGRTEKEAECEEDSDSNERTATDVSLGHEHAKAIGNDPATSQKGDTDEPEPVSNVENAGSSCDASVSLEKKVAHVLEEHNVVVEASRRLQKQAAKLSAKAAPMLTPEDDDVSANISSRDSFVDTISKPHWYTSAATNSTRAKKSVGCSSGTKKNGKPPKGNATLSDVSVAAKAMQGYGRSHLSRSSIARRRKEGTKSLDSINLDLNSIDKRTPSSLGNEMDALYSPSESNGSLKGTPRSVRFAELPPSYSASRTSDNSREGSPVRNMRRSDEQFVKIVSKALEERSDDKCREAYTASGNSKETLAALAPDDDPDGEGQPKEGTTSIISKKVSRSSRKSEGVARTDTHVVKNENGRTEGVSSHKPPRLQRTRTPHRVVRPKEGVQRSTVSRQQPSTKIRPVRPFSTRSVSLDSISSLQKPRSNVISTKEFDRESSERIAGTKGEENSNLANSSQEASKHFPLENGPQDANCETRSPQASDKDALEESSSAKTEPLQKKLFMTPESEASSSKTSKPLSRLTRRSSTGVLHSSNRDNVTSTSNISGTCDVTVVVKDSSVEFPSADEEELLFSPAAKPPLPERSATRKVSNGGFFAGQTAEWQQSVRAQSSPGRQTGVIPGRGLSENSGRLGRNPGKTSSSGVRSRVQSLRARLAALK